MVSFRKILQKLWDVYSSPVESPSTSKEDTNKNFNFSKRRKCLKRNLSTIEKIRQDKGIKLVTKKIGIRKQKITTT